MCWFNFRVAWDAPEPELCVSTNSLDFGTTSTSKTFTIENCGEGTLTWTISDNQPWLGVNPTSGSTTTETDTITVTVGRMGLASGPHSGTITVSSNGGTEYISVSMQVPEPDPPELCVSTNSLDFGTTSTSKTFTIENCGEGTLTWTISDNQPWLGVNPTSGSTTTETDTITVTVGRMGLASGPHSGTITVSSNGGTEYISVSMQVPGDEPNEPPYEPYNPSHSNGVTGVSLNADLSWSGGDPDGHSVTYDVYFEKGDRTPDQLVSDDQSGISYDPGTLDPGSHYYWQIEAKDEHGETRLGPVWDFTTQTPCIPAEKDIVVVVEGLQFKEFWDDVARVVVAASSIAVGDLLGALQALNIEFEFDEVDYLAKELTSTSWEISHFDWNRDASFTATHVDKLKEHLESEYNRAQCSGKKFIVVSHSWGTFLTYAALSKLAEEGRPVLVDVYITLSSPLGTYSVLEDYPLSEKPTAVIDAAIALYVWSWEQRLDLSVAPKIGRWINYWSWGDCMSGPVSSRFSWVEDRQISPSSKLYNPTTRAILTPYWHKYTSLIGSHVSWDNMGLADTVGYIITNAIKGKYVSSEYTADVDLLDIISEYGRDLLDIILRCPTDMVVTDPDGLIIGKDSNQIPGAVYLEDDFNEDGSLDDRVIIPLAKEGDYQITVIPEQSATPTDTYSLTASIWDSTAVLVDNSPVADIPDDPYVLTVTLPDEGSNTTVIIIASVSAFVVIAGLVVLLRRKRGEKQTP